MTRMTTFVPGQDRPAVLKTISDNTEHHATPLGSRLPAAYSAPTIPAETQPPATRSATSPGPATHPDLQIISERNGVPVGRLIFVLGWRVWAFLGAFGAGYLLGKGSQLLHAIKITIAWLQSF